MSAVRRLLVLVALLPACALRPSGEKAERRIAEEAGRPYAEPRPELPALPERPTTDDLLRRALAAHAGLEARYWEWRAAIERIPQDSSFPSLAGSYSYMYDYPFSLENLRAWNRTTIAAFNDPMTNIPFPTKLATAGQRALEEARAAGLRFQAARFRVQEEVLRAWYDWALLGRTLALVEEDAALLGLGADEVAGRVRSGAAGSSEQLRAQDLLDRTRSELERRRSEVAPLQARLNALLGRAPDEKLSFPDELPPPRVLPVSDLELLQLGAQRSAELAAFERQIAGREEALSLARQAVFPDFGISWNMMGTVSRTIGGMLVLPTRFEAIKAGIEEARALLKAAQAARAQYERDLKASFVVQLAVLRNAERQAAWFEETILPRARDQAALSRSVYAAGRGGFADVVEARRAVLGAEQTVAELRMERERALAALETWAAVDVEAMAPPAAAQPVGRAMR